MNSSRSESKIGDRIVHYYLFPGTPRWPGHRRDLTYAFNPGNQLSDDVKRVFANTIVQWSERTTLMFTETSSNNSADLKIGFFADNRGDGVATGRDLGTLANTFALAAGLLHLDSDETWIISDVLVLDLRR
ncbi:hypothetical protein SSX86_008069 [Deinandra increscens subsp. villosa]|uniref:Peptidase M10 metallopeptidase domain-containing protein n=1 Tax=Deinandra increscens subsp. villosa TaxID=3103831 RepID=A0AAP0H6H1_9ASTR